MDCKSLNCEFTILIRKFWLGTLNIRIAKYEIGKLRLSLIYELWNINSKFWTVNWFVWIIVKFE